MKEEVEKLTLEIEEKKTIFEDINKQMTLKANEVVEIFKPLAELNDKILAVENKIEEMVMDKVTKELNLFDEIVSSKTRKGILESSDQMLFNSQRQLVRSPLDL